MGFAASGYSQPPKSIALRWLRLAIPNHSFEAAPSTLRPRWRAAGALLSRFLVGETRNILLDRSSWKLVRPRVDAALSADRAHGRGMATSTGGKRDCRRARLRSDGADLSADRIPPGCSCLANPLSRKHLGSRGVPHLCCGSGRNNLLFY